MPPADDPTRPPDAPLPGTPASDEPTTRVGAPLEPAAEARLPRGCNPLTFGVVMATLEMALFLWLWQRCS